jgi:hypothetical protein
MKKILLVLALTLTGFLSQAQITFTSGTYGLWNMDTIYALSTGANPAITTGKVISVPTNFILHIQTRLYLDTLTSTNTLSSAGLQLQGSMDNLNWVNVPLSSTQGHLGCAFPGKSFQGLVLWAGYPVPGDVPSVASGATLAGITATTNADTVAVSAIGTARHMAMYTFTVNNPTFTYYRVVYQLKPSATSMALHIFTRYYLRKPY